MADDALGGIFNRYDTEIGVAGLHLLEYIVNSGQAQGMDRVPEMPVHRLLGKRALRTQVSDFQRFLLSTCASRSGRK